MPKQRSEPTGAGYSVYCSDLIAEKRLLKNIGFFNSLFIRLYVNSWGKEKPIERKKQVVKNETERSKVEFSLPAFARWVIEICTEYENGSV